MTFLFLLLPPILAALIAFGVRPYRPLVGWINAALGLVSLGAALTFASQAVALGLPANGALQTAATFGVVIDSLGLVDVLRVDSLSALLMICVTGVSAITLFLSPGFWRKDSDHTPQQLRHYQIFFNLFV